MQFKMLHGIGSPGEDLAPEYVDIAFRNVEGATITLGLPVVFTNLAASLDGGQAVLPKSTCQRMFAGISFKTVPNNGIGLARALGYFQSVAIFATGSSGTVALDEILGVGATGSLGVNSTGLLARPGGFVIACEAIGAAVNSPGGYAKGYVKCL